MAKSFADGDVIRPHAHERDPFPYAVRGIMRIRTCEAGRMAPPDRAVYMPAGMTHEIAIQGDLEIRTHYIAPGAAPGLPPARTVLEVSDLLRDVVLALIDEHLLDDEGGRGGALALLVLSEIGRARRLARGVPKPRDARLRSALLADPSRSLILEGRSETAGASTRTLARLFERGLGMTFSTSRRRVRMQIAVEEIVAGTPVALVAAHSSHRSVCAFPPRSGASSASPTRCWRRAGPSRKDHAAIAAPQR
jgi:AraC-like DNA-binding protein